MTQHTWIDDQQYETTAESGHLSASLVKQAQTAIKSLDLNECQHIVNWAVENPHPAAGPALCALLKRPNGIKARNTWRKAEWIDMRVQAVRALQRLSDKLAAPTLAYVLIDDVEDVSLAASDALQSLGEYAAIPIVDSIRTSYEWPLDGMRAAIRTLGAVGHKSAGPTLARILFGLLPNRPHRWVRLQIKWALALGVVETGIFLTTLGVDTGIDRISLDGLIGISICALLLTGVFSLLSALAVGVVLRHGKNLESARLYSAAAEALVSIKDTRSVPSLVEVATEKYAHTARAAALGSLVQILPALQAKDYGLLSSTIERRLTGMFSQDSPELLLSIVRALEFVGTGQSAEYVERLSRRRVSAYAAADYKLVKSESQRVLPILEERRRQDEAANILLRPASMAHEKSELLLRPATSLATYEQDAEELLRANS